MNESTGHIVLLGDSIFDNGAYVSGGPDLVAQLRSRLPQGWSASLVAVDGAVVSDVPGQLAGIPVEATHLVVSAGGNDALGASGVLAEKASSVADAVQRLAAVRDCFRTTYEKMTEAVLQRRLPTALCTVPSDCQPKLSAGLHESGAFWNV
jgi:hypothetical protein